MTQTSAKTIKIGFFGTPDYAVTVLEHLARAGFELGFVVTAPDRPRGRGLHLTPPPAKVWAEAHQVPVLQPEKLRNNPDIVQALQEFHCDVFVVIAYGQIIPLEILELPAGHTLNIHGSLLPRLRGSCPIETAILDDERETGVTIMRVDALMDHGPILASRKVTVEPWPPTAAVLGQAIVEAGADLLIEILPDWLAGKLPEKPQDHARATITQKITKTDGLIDLTDDPYLNYRKIQAYHEWPQAYFLAQKRGQEIRVKIAAASFAAGQLTIERVIPEGGREMAYTDFLKGLKD